MIETIAQRRFFKTEGNPATRLPGEKTSTVHPLIREEV